MSVKKELKFCRKGVVKGVFLCLCINCKYENKLYMIVILYMRVVVFFIDVVSVNYYV